MSKFKNNNFKPKLTAQNVTGVSRLRWLDKALSRPSQIKKLLGANLIDRIIPLHKRTFIRWQLRQWNTISKPTDDEDNFSRERQILKKRFHREIVEVESLLGITLEKWK